MFFSRITGTPALLLALLFVQGCSSWEVNHLAEQLAASGPGQTLQALEKIDPPKRDRAQYLLNRGMLKFYAGDLAGSRDDLELAKSIMAALQASSVTENATAITTNETLRSYTGTPSDQVLVHVILALGYLAKGDLDGARVEMLQAQVTMQQLAKDDSTSGQLASARYLAGVIYELNGEWDDAMISYRQSYTILQKEQQPIPPALQDTLLMVSKRQGMDDEYKRYKSAFGRDAVPAPDGAGTVILFYLDGVVSTRFQSRLSVLAGSDTQFVTLAIPAYYPVRSQPSRISLQAGAQHNGAALIENLEQRARDDLAAQMPTIIATGTVRVVAKYNMVNEAQNSGDLQGILANIATMASEQADVRSWNMLPAYLQIARITVAPGTVPVVPERTQTQDLLALQQAAQGRKVVLILSSLTTNPLSYPPQPALAETAPEQVADSGQDTRPDNSRSQLGSQSQKNVPSEVSVQSQESVQSEVSVQSQVKSQPQGNSP